MARSCLPCSCSLQVTNPDGRANVALETARTLPANGPCRRMRNTAEHPAVRNVFAPYDSGYRGLRVGAGPDYLMNNRLPEMLRSAGVGRDGPVWRRCWGRCSRL